MAAELYLQRAIEVLQSLDRGRIKQGAQLFADTILGGHSIFSFGASHAFMITEELVYRAGGLMVVHPIYPHGMNLSVRPLTLTSKLERVPGVGSELLASSPAREGDALILTSNSGRNAVTIDMAVLAREKKIHTIGIVSLAASTRTASRH